MRLRELVLRRYRQFVDERLVTDPLVTVIVGRNDTGKTGLLNRFFDQYLMGRAFYGTDAPLSCATKEGNFVAFSLTWDVSPGDAAHYPFRDAFGRSDIRKVEVVFDASRPQGDRWAFRADDVPAVAYQGRGATGWPILRDVFMGSRLFPPPHFITIGDRRLMPAHFEARFYEPREPEEEAPSLRHLISLEALLLRTAGLAADTRAPWGKGTEEPWQTPLMGRAPGLTPAELQAHLANVAKRMTQLLKRWWDDPADLTFRLRLVTDQEFNRKLNSYLIEWSITDGGGTRRDGAGLNWFVAFAVELLHLEDQPGPCLLLIDEPATPLHPGMQKRVARMLGTLADRHQTIYSTHSPFLIDWSFPQRLRVFEPDYEGQRSKINNRPHADAEGQGVWDPLRRSVGVTLGDVTGLSAESVFVEGVTDQIILANVSTLLISMGRSGLDLSNVSIVPYGEELALRRLLAMVKVRRYHVVVLADSDEQGSKVVAFCRRDSVACIELREYCHGGKARVAAIEDVVGIEGYVSYVNAYYARFDWFTAFDAVTVSRDLSENNPPRTLGKYVQDQFRQRFDRDFDKVAVAVEIANGVAQLPSDVLDRMEALLSMIRDRLR